MTESGESEDDSVEQTELDPQLFALVISCKTAKCLVEFLPETDIVLLLKEMLATQLEILIAEIEHREIDQCELMEFINVSHGTLENLEKIRETK